MSDNQLMEQIEQYLDGGMTRVVCGVLRREKASFERLV